MALMALPVFLYDVATIADPPVTLLPVTLLTFKTLRDAEAALDYITKLPGLLAPVRLQVIQRATTAEVEGIGHAESSGYEIDKETIDVLLGKV